MKNFKFFILLIFLFFCSCMRKDLFHPGLAYTLSKKTFYELSNEYKNVPFHSGQDLEVFVDSLVTIKTTEYIKGIDSNSQIALQAVINRKGEVESIIQLNSVCRSFDSLAVDALKRSKFKPLSFNLRLSKYRILVNYLTTKDEYCFPFVNGKSKNNSYLFFVTESTTIDELLRRLK